MNELQTFNFHGSDIRTLEIEGEPWFILADVCKALELTNVSVVAQTLDDDEKSKLNLGLSGGSTNCVNEQGLYEVIFQSRKEEAKLFRKWIKTDVLPSIRKHGAYMTDRTLEEAITNPDFLIKLATELKEEQQKRKALQVVNSQLTVDNQIMKPKADYFDDLVERNLLTNFRDTAKELKVGQKQFVNYLIEKKYLYRDNKGKLKPYANYKTNGLFELKEYVNQSSGHTDTQTLITPKGRETFRLLFEAN